MVPKRGGHDLHFVAIRHIRRGRIRALLFAGDPATSGSFAGAVEPVLLRLWTARIIADGRGRGPRNVPVFNPGDQGTGDLVAYWHRLQSRSARLLQIQIFALRSGSG